MQWPKETLGMFLVRLIMFFVVWVFSSLFGLVALGAFVFVVSIPFSGIIGSLPIQLPEYIAFWSIFAITVIDNALKNVWWTFTHPENIMKGWLGGYAKTSENVRKWMIPLGFSMLFYVACIVVVYVNPEYMQRLADLRSSGVALTPEMESQAQHTANNHSFYELRYASLAMLVMFGIMYTKWFGHFVESTFKRLRPKEDPVD